MEANLVKRKDRWDLYNEDGHKIASTLEGCKNKLSLKNCEVIANGYDLDELAKKHYNGHIKRGHTEEDSLQRKIDFTIGFVSALEILGDKKFSKEDVKLAIEYGIQSVLQAVPGVTSTQSVLDNYTQSIQQTEWDVEIMMDMILVGQCDCPCHDGEGMMHSMACCNPKMVDSPKLDADECLILKRK